MVEFFVEYGLFLAKAVTVIIGILIVIAAGAAAASSQKNTSEKGDIVITPLNEFYDDLQDAIKETVLSKDALKEEKKQKKKAEKANKDKKKQAAETRKKRIYVLDFDGDIQASGVDNLTREITAVLTVAEAQDEVVLRLESPGGQVHSYGLAASQLQRIRAHNIELTVSVDKVAASGGYMMACVANTIVAAPFAILGSIGVVAELPNFNRALKKYDVDYDIYTAGEFKRTVTMLGENTAEGKQKFIEEIEETHVLFKDMVHKQRPQLEMSTVATGEHWYGTQCLDLGLVDKISTSEDYLFAASKSSELFEVSYEEKKTMADRLGFAMEAALERSVSRVLGLVSGGRPKV